MRRVLLSAVLVLAPLAAGAQAPDRIIPRLQPQVAGPYAIEASMSVDGCLVVTQSDGGLHVWSADDGVLLYRIDEAADAMFSSVAARRDVIALGLPSPTGGMHEIVTLAFDARGVTEVSRTRLDDSITWDDLDLSATGEAVRVCWQEGTESLCHVRNANSLGDRQRPDDGTHVFPDRRISPDPVAMAKGGRYALRTAEHFAEVRDARTQQVVSTLHPLQVPGPPLKWFPVGTHLATEQTNDGGQAAGSSDCHFTFRSAASGAVLSEATPWTVYDSPYDGRRMICPLPDASSPDGSTLALLAGQAVILWPVAGGDSLLIETPDMWPARASYSGDGQRLFVGMTGDEPYAWGVYDTATGASLPDSPEQPLVERFDVLLHQTTERLGGVDSLRNSELLVDPWSASDDLSRGLLALDSLYVVETASGEAWAIARPETSYWKTRATLSANGGFVTYTTGCSDSPEGFVHLLDASTGAPRLFDAPEASGDRQPGVAACNSLVTPDERYLVAWNDVVLWDADWLGSATPDRVNVWEIETGRHIADRAARAVTGTTPDGRFLYLSDPDGRLVLWNPWTDEALSVFLFADDTWAVIDSQGRYDASNAGDIDGLLWILDTPDGPEAVRLSQFKALYYEPKLLARHLGLPTARGPHRDVSAVRAAGVALYPRVEITAVSAETATIRLTDRGGGIGPVQVLVNGTEILADARGAGDLASGGEITVDLGAAQRFLVPGANVLEVVASNADGSLRSRRIRAPFEVADLRGQGPEGRAPEAYTPHLWAVVVGTSDYLDDALDLSFAAKDAVDIAAALRIAGGRLLSPERTHVTVLSTESDDLAQWPTRERVLAALDSVATRADPRDVLVVYLAGHGVVGAGDDYTYLTHEAVSLPDRGPGQAPASGDAPGALSSAALTDAFKKVPALKRVLILDTCASGSVVEDLSVVRATDGDQTRSLDRLKDRTGTFILAGSTADRPSYEASQYAQGLLTWSLLDGMRGAALRDGGEVDVARLFGHALDTVPALARGVGGVQAPTMAMPAGGGSFPIGRVTEADQARIPLNAPRAVVTPAQFFDADALTDDLGLAAAVNAALRDASAEPLAPLVFRDVQAYPGGVAIRGLYTREGDAVSVRVGLSREGGTPAPFEVAGSASDISALVTEIVARIESALRN